MKLSDAIVLGDTLKRPDSTKWISNDGKCGCALGGALLAVGIDPVAFNRESMVSVPGEWPSVKARWPWLTRDHLSEISNLYHEVCHGRRTLEDVVVYVRSVEPPQTVASVAPAPCAIEVPVG